MSEPGAFPEGFSVDAVDWLPSGARSGLIRVRGHRPPAVTGPLPELILEVEGETKRFVSLPDPRADRDPSAWRGAYVLDAKPAAEADQMWLEWPGQRRIPLPPLNVPIHQVQVAEEPAEAEGGDEVVIDRAVLAERRARRAEAAEQAQARIAREALRAVEVLELRTGELEQRVSAAEAERDALREQASVAGEAPDARLEVLQAEVRELRAALAEREAAPAPTAEPRPIAAGEAERRAERLRTALTATVATVAELRLRLHEAEVARRTRDVARAADAVRLAVVENERAAWIVELEQARRGLEEARRARDEAAAELQGVRAAYEDVQSRHRDVTAELGAARERMAELEAEVAAVGAEAERAARNATEAARAADTIADLGSRLARAESALAEAETARELAEAAALAADAERRAAAVASAASRPAPNAPKPTPEVSPRVLGDRRPSDPPSSVPAAGLTAAAEAQTQRAEAERAPDPQLAADLQAAKLRITTEADHPPADVARGRGTREYPPLRGALVKLAHDDPAAAGRMLAGLLRAQHAVFHDPPDYDITIEEVGTFAVSPAGLTTLVSPIERPRGRTHARFHLEGDALTLAEALSGVEARPRRRRGPLRAHGRIREARRLTEELREVSLAELVSAGAELDPELVLRGLAYAIRPAWTQGQVWAVELTVEDSVLTVAARHSGGLTVTSGPHETTPDARLRLSGDAFRDLVAGEEPALHIDGDEAVVWRLLSLAERARAGSP